ncbi:MAG: peptide deformylase [Eubacteriales bacterium]
MAIRTILTQDDDALKLKSRTVDKFDQKLWDLLDDMSETLTQANGLGLAAPQIGILRRVVLVMDNEGEYLELINPEIISTEGEEEGLEGCLSVPGAWGYVKRPTIVTVKAQDRNGEEFEILGDGMMARCFCHELDHLEGVLYTAYCDDLYTQEQIDEMEEGDQ